MAQTHSKQQWLDWIDEQEQSGLSVADHGLYKANGEKASIYG